MDAAELDAAREPRDRLASRAARNQIGQDILVADGGRDEHVGLVGGGDAAGSGKGLHHRGAIHGRRHAPQTVSQSSLMLATVHPSASARASACSAPPGV